MFSFVRSFVQEWVMAKLSDRLMRDLVLIEIRQAVSDCFLPVGVLARVISRTARMLMGQPGRTDPGWWRSA
jgi:hypothetical protein